MIMITKTYTVITNENSYSTHNLQSNRALSHLYEINKGNVTIYFVDVYNEWNGDNELLDAMSIYDYDEEKYIDNSYTFNPYPLSDYIWS